MPGGRAYARAAGPFPETLASIFRHFAQIFKNLLTSAPICVIIEIPKERSCPNAEKNLCNHHALFPFHYHRRRPRSVHLCPHLSVRFLPLWYFPHHSGGITRSYFRLRRLFRFRSVLHFGGVKTPPLSFLRFTLTI